MTDQQQTPPPRQEVLQPGEPPQQPPAQPTRALSIRERSSSFAPGGPISAAEWGALAEIGSTVAGTDFVPKDLRNNPAAIMACLLYGREQGIGPMTSLQEISMIDGRPSMSAALMLAKIRAAGHEVSGSVSAQGAKAVGRRSDTGTEMEYEFTMEMAARAGLAGKTGWQKYPEAMCWARCVSQLARFLFSDVFIGAPYTKEELGADVDAEGQVIEGTTTREEPRDEAAPTPTPQPAPERPAAPEAPQEPQPPSAEGPPAEAARRAQEAAQGQQGDAEDRGGAVAGAQVEEPADALTAIEEAEQREANLPMPIAELTYAVLEKLPRNQAIAFMDHLGITYDKKATVGEYRAMLIAYLETAGLLRAAGQEQPEATADPFGGEQEYDPEAEAAAQARQHRIEQLDKVLAWSAEHGQRWTLELLKQRAPEQLGRAVETLNDLTDEELNNVWRSIPDNVKTQALEA